MKRHILFSLLLIVATSLTSCNNDTKQIEKTAYGYLNATGNYLTEEARPFASPETQKTLDFLKDVLIPLTDTSYIAANTPAEITIDSINLTNEDSAVVFYTKVTPLKTLEAQITVVKFDGKWLVDIPLDIPEDTTSNQTFTVPAAPSIIKQ